MPIIEMHLLKGRTDEQKRRVAVAVAEAVSKALDCSPNTVRLLITEHGPEEFSIAGVTVGARNEAQAASVSTNPGDQE